MASEPRPERGEEVGTGTSTYLGKHALSKSVEASSDEEKRARVSGRG